MGEIGTAEYVRRSEIVAGVQKISDAIVLAASSHQFDPASSQRESSVAAIRELTSQVLALFKSDDDEIAWWTQVELFGGLAEPMSLAYENQSLVAPDGGLLFTPPRASELTGWAKGEYSGPRFRGHALSAPNAIDPLRERWVVPFSEAPPGMLWAPALDWRNK